MIAPLSQLRKEFHDYPNGQHNAMGCLGIYHCHHTQQLREVPLYQPMIMLIVTGHKEALLNERRLWYTTIGCLGNVATMANKSARGNHYRSTPMVALVPSFFC